VNVNWYDASAFCEWASKVSGLKVRLPSEAEWEKAARGTDGRIYPWGDQVPDKQRSNYNDNLGDTTPVGKYSPAGDSPYGCVDLAGNVWEWVADWYGDNDDNNDDENYDENSPVKNPAGPASGDWRVLRGGSWDNSVSSLRVSNRDWGNPESWSGDGGFRCAR
jgi:serine/threonine-protein kinase